MAIPQPKTPQPEDKKDQAEVVPSASPPVQPVPTPETKPGVPLVESFIDRGKTYNSGETVYPENVRKLNEQKIAERKAAEQAGE